ncbi:hypothetical protein ACQPZJ_44335 [Actinoplanes sp. CA-054009]
MSDQPAHEPTATPEPDGDAASPTVADLGTPGHDHAKDTRQGLPGVLGVQYLIADVSCDDAGRPYADTVLTLNNGQQITVTIHLSQAYSNTVNIEIDGDFTADAPSLRVNLNDNLVLDSTRDDPAVPSPRRPDLPDPDAIRQPVGQP